MRHSTKTLLVVLLTVMSFLAVQTVWAEKPDPPESDWLTVSGVIVKIEPEISTITIAGKDGDVVIKGFPFGYLEREMAVDFGDDFVIAVGDCVEVEYAIVVCRCIEGSKNIAVALNSYCVATGEDACDGEYCCAECYDGSIVLRDDDFYPVDKSRNDDDDDHYHHQNRPGNGS